LTKIFSKGTGAISTHRSREQNILVTALIICYVRIGSLYFVAFAAGYIKYIFIDQQICNIFRQKPRAILISLNRDCNTVNDKYAEEFLSRIVRVQPIQKA